MLAFVVAGAGVTLVAAGCSSTAADNAAAGGSGSSGSYSIASAGDISLGGAKLDITGGSISGSTGSMTSTAAFSFNLTDVNVSPTSMTINLGSGQTTLQASTSGSMVFSGPVMWNGNQESIQNLTLLTAPPPPPVITYNITASGTVAFASISPTPITGGAITGSTGSVSTALPFAIELSKVAVTPTSLTASLGGGAVGTLKGSNNSYSGKVTAGNGLVYTFSGLTLQAPTPAPPAITYLVGSAGTFKFGTTSINGNITGGTLRGSVGSITLVPEYPFIGSGGQLNLSDISVTPTSLTANFGGGVVTLTGQSSVYSGTAKINNGQTLQITGLTLTKA